MKTIIPLVFSAVLGGASAAYGVEQPATPHLLTIGVTHQALFAVAFDGAQGYAVGARGEILHSADHGQTWAPEATPSTLGLLGVAAAAGHAVAVGQMGTILRRGDDGRWVSVDASGGDRLLSVAFNSKGLGIITGSFGTVLRSTDFGATWTRVKIDWAPLFAADADTLGIGFAPHVYTAAVGEDGSIVIGCELSTLLRSTDGGQTWTPVQHGGLNKGIPDPSIFALRIAADGLGFAVGQSGTIFRTRDHGQTWSPLKSGTDAILLGVEMDAHGRVLVSGIREMLRSADQGETWQPVAGADINSTWYEALADSGGPLGVVAVGQSAQILSLPE